jgi:hypothetical protein
MTGTRAQTSYRRVVTELQLADDAQKTMQAALSRQQVARVLMHAR